VGNEKSHPAKSATFKHATGEIAFTYKSKWRKPSPIQAFFAELEHLQNPGQKLLTLTMCPGFFDFNVQN
jgi:hypothetical protein